MPQAQEKQIRSQIVKLQSELKLRQLEARPLAPSVLRAYETVVNSQYNLLETLSKN